MSYGSYRGCLRLRAVCNVWRLPHLPSFLSLALDYSTSFRLLGPSTPSRVQAPCNCAATCNRRWAWQVLLETPRHVYTVHRSVRRATRSCRYSLGWRSTRAASGLMCGLYPGRQSTDLLSLSLGLRPDTDHRPPTTRKSPPIQKLDYENDAGAGCSKHSDVG